MRQMETTHYKPSSGYPFQSHHLPPFGPLLNTSSLRVSYTMHTEHVWGSRRSSALTCHCGLPPRGVYGQAEARVRRERGICGPRPGSRHPSLEPCTGTAAPTTPQAHTHKPSRAVRTAARMGLCRPPPPPSSHWAAHPDHIPPLRGTGDTAHRQPHSASRPGLKGFCLWPEA